MEENNSAQRIQEINSLQLTYKGLTDFPDYLLTDKVYQALKLLYLGRNSISTLPENLSNLSSLTGLFINHNKLQFLPEGIGKLSELRILELTNNNLTAIPIDLSYCSNLEILNLDNNRLTFLPRQLRELHNLTELSIVGNNLYVLPQEIGRNDCFRTLYVDNNQCLYSLPSSVDFKDIGFIGCASVPLSSEILDAYFHVYVRHTLTSKLPLLLPPDLHNICNMKHCIPTLLELSLRVAYANLHPFADIDDTIPYNLKSYMKCSTARCEKCKKDIFVSAFPVVFKRNTFSGYLLGMCCSLKCVKTCYQGGDLSMVYPSMEDMSLALVLVQ